MPVLAGIPAVAAVIGFHGPGLAQQAPCPDDLASAPALAMTMDSLSSPVRRRLIHGKAAG